MRSKDASASFTMLVGRTFSLVPMVTYRYNQNEKTWRGRVFGRYEAPGGPQRITAQAVESVLEPLARATSAHRSRPPRRASDWPSIARARFHEGQARRRALTPSRSRGRAPGGCFTNRR